MDMDRLAGVLFRQLFCGSGEMFFQKLRISGSKSKKYNRYRLWDEKKVELKSI